MEINDNVQASTQNYEPRPDNFLVWAILTTLCCCSPFGIVAIYYSGRVNAYHESGNYGKAVESSREAKKWVLVSAVLGVVIWIAYAVFYAVAGASALAGINV